MLSVAPALAQVPDTLTLYSVLEHVRTHHPGLRAERLEAEALETRSTQALAWLRPQFSFQYHGLFPVVTANGPQRSQWQVSQPIPYAGIPGVESRIAEMTAGIATVEARSFELDLVHRAKQAFYQLMRIQLQTELVNVFAVQLQDFETASAALYEVGVNRQEAILKAQVEKNVLLQRLITLERERSTALQVLSRAVGYALSPSSVVEYVSMPVEPPHSDSLMALAQRSRPDLAGLRLTIERAQLQTHSARLMLRPELGVSVAYVDIASGDAASAQRGRDAVALGMSVKIPLHRSRRNSAVKEALLREAQAKARLEDLEHVIRSEIAEYVTHLRLGIEQIVTYRTALIPQAETALTAALGTYTAGRTGYLELLDTERVLFGLRMSLVELQVQQYLSIAALERTLGVDELGPDWE